MSAWIGRILFILMAAFTVWLVGNQHETLLSQTVSGVRAETAPTSGGDLQLVATMLPTGTQQIVVLDPSLRTLAIYHVEPNQGKLQLKSVRNLVWDLRMEQFNGQSPLPSELRQVQP